MRVKPDVTVRIASPNQSDRTTPVSLIVLHSTESDNREGSGDLQSIAQYFSTSSAEASSHVIVDDEGHSARCVPDARKAWTCVSYNSLSLNIEQIGRASQPKWSEAEYRECARWIAQWSHEHRIPIRRAITSGGRVLRSGVTTHKKLGPLGGGHSDPGPNYSLRHVLKLARRIKRERYGR